MMASEKNTALLSSAVYNDTRPKKKFVSGLYGCFDYVSPITNRKRCIPLFCPIAMICTPSILGTIYSRLNDEEAEFCSMGREGGFCCIVNWAIAFLGPCGGMFCFGAESLALRKSVIQKHNVIDDDAYCCGSENLGSIHLMCSYPCSLFQIAVSLEEWNHEKKINIAKVVAIEQPSVDKGINI